MELLGAAPRCPPLEIHHRVGASRHGLHRPQAVHARAFWRVARPPVDRARGLLHQVPRLAVPQRPHQITPERRVDLGVVGLKIRVGVVRHEVLVFRPLEIIERLEEAHEVGGHRHVRGHAPQNVELRQVAAKKRIRREAAKVELLSRIGEVGRLTRRLDLVERAVALAPKRGAPGAVQGRDVAVAVLQPATEIGARYIAVTRVDMGPVFVGDMPQRERRMASVAIGHRGAHRNRGVTEDGGARAVVLARAHLEPHPVGGHGQGFRVKPREPGRR
jgi:hypothetical protein